MWLPKMLKKTADNGNGADRMQAGCQKGGMHMGDIVIGIGVGAIIIVLAEIIAG